MNLKKTNKSKNSKQPINTKSVEGILLLSGIALFALGLGLTILAFFNLNLRGFQLVSIDPSQRNLYFKVGMMVVGLPLALIGAKLHKKKFGKNT